MSSYGGKALDFWKNMEKNAGANKSSFKISRKRKNTLVRKKKASSAPTNREPVTSSTAAEAAPKAKDKVEPKSAAITEQAPAAAAATTAAAPTAAEESAPQVAKTVEPTPAPSAAPAEAAAKSEPVQTAASESNAQSAAAAERKGASTGIAETKEKEAAEAETKGASDAPFPCRVKYDFNPEEDTEISIKKGEIIMILEVSDTGWCLGKLPGKVEGWVPMDYLDRIEDPIVEKKKLNSHAQDMRDSAAKLGSVDASPVEPKRESPMGEETKAVFDYLGKSQMFNQAIQELKGEMQIRIEDLIVLLEAGDGLAWTLAYMRFIDERRQQLKDMKALQEAVLKLRVEWTETIAVLKIKRKWTAEEAARVLQQTPAGKDADAMLKGYQGDAEGAVKFINDVFEKRRAEAKRGRSDVLDYLGSDKCGLFSSNCSVSQAALDALFAGRTADEVLAKVKALNDAKEKFPTFEKMVERVSGSKVESVKTTDQASFQPVLQYLSSPQCRLFGKASGLRVSSQEIRKLLELYENDVQRVLCDASVLNATGAELLSFSDLATALQSQPVKDYKEKIFAVVRDEKSNIFSVRPDRFTDENLYELLAACTTKLDFLPAILKNLASKPSSMEDLISTVDELVTAAAGNEAKEQAAVVDFLSKNGIFSAEFPVTTADAQQLIWTSQFSKWGLSGGSVKDVLNAIVASKDSVFDSFEGLIKAVAQRAEKMGNQLRS